MGHSASKNPKINKNHNRLEMFKIGISFGRNDLNLEGHLQMGYNSKAIKNYDQIITVEPQPAEDEPIIKQDDTFRCKQSPLRM
jgi:hypothetical protein